MKPLLTAMLVCAVSTSCASLSYGKKLTENTPKLMIGMTSAQVTDALDSPDLVSAQGPLTVWHYNLLVKDELVERTVPYFVLFDKGQAVAFGVDQAAAQQQAANSYLRAHQLQHAGESMRSLSNQLSTQSKPRTTQCLSRPDGVGGVITNCSP